MLWFQVLGSSRFKHGFDGVNLHCPTLGTTTGSSQKHLLPGAYTRPLFSST